MPARAEREELRVDVGADNHVHTSLCNHAAGSMEEYVLAGIKRGLHTITFLEHLEAGITYFERTWLTAEDFDRYFLEGRRLQDKYSGSIKVRLGVEIGYNPEALPELQERLQKHQWDLKGLSYHFLAAGKDHLNMVSRRRGNLEAFAKLGPDRILSAYFAGLTEAVAQLDCQVLCHLDAALRHYPDLRFNSDHLDAVDRLLELIREKNMSLEVNTSGFSLRGEPYPGRAILGRALQLGIPLSAGSDAHNPEQVGRHFDLLPGYLSGIGQPVDADPADDIEPSA